MHMTELVNGHPELEGVRKFDDISDLDILIFTYVEK